MKNVLFVIITVVGVVVWLTALTVFLDYFKWGMQ